MKFSNLQGKKNFFLKKLMRKAENLRGNHTGQGKEVFFNLKNQPKTNYVSMPEKIYSSTLLVCSFPHCEFADEVDKAVGIF